MWAKSKGKDKNEEKQEDDNEIMPLNYEEELNKIVINESQNNSNVSEKIEAI